jgi:hypothetical protein
MRISVTSLTYETNRTTLSRLLSTSCQECVSLLEYFMLGVRLTCEKNRTTFSKVSTSFGLTHIHLTIRANCWVIAFNVYGVEL